MFNINLDDGYKEITINNDENRVIRFNPTDFNIVNRINAAPENIKKRIETIESDQEGTLDDVAEVTATADKIVREEIDKIFNAPVSDIVFQNQSTLSLSGGVTLWERFVESAGKYIAEEVKKEVKASNKRIEKYTKVVRK